MNKFFVSLSSFQLGVQVAWVRIKVDGLNWARSLDTLKFFVTGAEPFVWLYGVHDPETLRLQPVINSFSPGYPA